MPRKKETIVDVVAETKDVEAKPKPATKQITASKTAKSESPSLPSKTTVAAKATTPTPKPKKVPQAKPKTITRIELTQEVAKAVGQYMEITNRDAELIVAEIINSMIDSLKEGDEIEIRGFGAFRIRSRNPRNGRNPKTGEAVAVPSKSVVYFKMGKGLKEKFVER